MLIRDSVRTAIVMESWPPAQRSRQPYKSRNSHRSRYLRLQTICSEAEEISKTEGVKFQYQNIHFVFDGFVIWVQQDTEYCSGMCHCDPESGYSVGQFKDFVEQVLRQESLVNSGAGSRDAAKQALVLSTNGASQCTE